MSVLHRIHYIIASIVTLIHFMLTGLQTLIADMDKNKAEITVLMFLRVRVLYACFIGYHEDYPVDPTCCHATLC